MHSNVLPFCNQSLLERRERAESSLLLCQHDLARGFARAPFDERGKNVREVKRHLVAPAGLDRRDVHAESNRFLKDVAVDIYTQASVNQTRWWNEGRRDSPLIPSATHLITPKASVVYLMSI